jgi:hypothetical protein
VKNGTKPQPLWAYVYQIVPSQTLSRLQSIRALLQDEHARAEHEARHWASRVVTEGETTRILIVTDNKDTRQPIDRQLVEELSRLTVTVTVSEPLVVAG